MQNQVLNNSWRGLGGWNFYFLLKFILLAYGYLNFNPFKNLVFLAFLLFPLASDRLHRVRQWVALPIGLALFYHDTWLPGINTLMSQGANLFDFSFQYNLELINRFINWQLVGALFVVMVAYLFIRQWLRFTLFTIIGVIWLNLPLLDMAKFQIFSPQTTAGKIAQPSEQRSSDEVATNEQLPLSLQIDNYVNNFYEQESLRKTNFPSTLPEDFAPFHVLFVHVCSMAWADLNSIQQANNPLWQSFDIVFDNFNGAASYSNPAALRFLRGSCGQPKIESLFKTLDTDNCFIMENLENLGFKRHLMLDHDGKFADFLVDIQRFGGLNSIPLMSQKNLKPVLEAFYSGPIFDNDQILDRWTQMVESEANPQTATFYNLIPLHDGNRTIGGLKTAPYEPLVITLSEDIQRLFAKLEQQQRKVVVVVIGAHGRNYAGDSIQMSGLRDIPTPDITNVPVGIKLIGLDAPNSTSAITIKDQTSYLALTELVSRMIKRNVFNQKQIDWPLLTKDLPKTAVVSENESATVVQYNQNYYVRLRGDSSWVPLPR